MVTSEPRSTKMEETASTTKPLKCACAASNVEMAITAAKSRGLFKLESSTMRRDTTLHKHGRDEFRAVHSFGITEIREQSLKFTRNQLSLFKKKSFFAQWVVIFWSLPEDAASKGSIRNWKKFRHCRSKDDTKETEQGCTFNIPVKL